MSDQENHPSSPWSSESHENPLVGKYERWKQGDWSTDAIIGGLDYPINIIAKGNEPCKAQLDRFTELIARLPEIIASSNLMDAPTDEWRNKHPEYRLVSARISFIRMHEDGSFCFWLDAYPQDDWAPGFDISPDFKVTLAEWGV
ncbi:MAG: hypothetical protein V4495_27590 [Pseudomonadota bacterium]